MSNFYNNSLILPRPFYSLSISSINIFFAHHCWYLQVFRYRAHLGQIALRGYRRSHRIISNIPSKFQTLFSELALKMYLSTSLTEGKTSRKLSSSNQHSETLASPLSVRNTRRATKMRRTITSKRTIKAFAHHRHRLFHHSTRIEEESQTNCYCHHKKVRCFGSQELRGYRRSWS